MDTVCDTVFVAILRNFWYVSNIGAQGDKKDAPPAWRTCCFGCACCCEHYLLKNDIGFTQICAVIWLTGFIYYTYGMALYMFYNSYNGKCTQHFTAKKQIGIIKLGDDFLSEYLRPNLTGELRGISVLGVAHVGDAVFELMVRTWLCTQGTSTAKKLHGGTVAFVSARAQAEASARIMPILSEEEIAVFKRGRNAHANSVPRGSTYEEYHLATGLEALFGHLYLSGKSERLGELFEKVINEDLNSTDVEN